MAEGGTNQDMKGNQPSEANAQSGDDGGKDLSGHRRIPNERGELTNWRRPGEGLVRIQNENDVAKYTNFLETAEGETCQDSERNRPSDVHLLPGDDRTRDLS